jgi:hypothetical protein
VWGLQDLKSGLNERALESPQLLSGINFDDSESEEKSSLFIKKKKNPSE